MRISDWSSDVCSSDLVDLNAFLHIDRDLTLAQADAADQQLAQGQAGPLTGIPIAHKDVFATQGWRTTAASKMLEHYTSPRSEESRVGKEGVSTGRYRWTP